MNSVQVSLKAAIFDLDRPPPSRTGSYEICGRIGQDSSNSRSFPWAIFDTKHPTHNVALLAIAWLDPRESQAMARRLTARLRQFARTPMRGVLPVLDVFEDDECVVIVFERMEAVPITALLHEHRLDALGVTSVALQLLNTLPSLGELGVGIGALQPETLLVTFDGRIVTAAPVVSAILEMLQGETSSVVTCPGYAPPELLRGEDSTQSSDQYAIGRVLIDLATGRPADDDRSSIASFHGGWEHYPIDVAHDALRPILARMISSWPGDRYPSLLACANDLIDVASTSGRTASLADARAPSSRDAPMWPSSTIEGTVLATTIAITCPTSEPQSPEETEAAQAEIASARSLLLPVCDPDVPLVAMGGHLISMLEATVTEWMQETSEHSVELETTLRQHTHSHRALATEWDSRDLRTTTRDRKPSPTAKDVANERDAANADANANGNAIGSANASAGPNAAMRASESERHAQPHFESLAFDPSLHPGVGDAESGYPNESADIVFEATDTMPSLPSHFAGGDARGDFGARPEPTRLEYYGRKATSPSAHDLGRALGTAAGLPEPTEGRAFVQESFVRSAIAALDSIIPGRSRDSGGVTDAPVFASAPASTVDPSDAPGTPSAAVLRSALNSASGAGGNVEDYRSPRPAPSSNETPESDRLVPVPDDPFVRSVVAALGRLAFTPVSASDTAPPPLSPITRGTPGSGGSVGSPNSVGSPSSLGFSPASAARRPRALRGLPARPASVTTIPALRASLTPQATTIPSSDPQPALSSERAEQPASRRDGTNTRSALGRVFQVAAFCVGALVVLATWTSKHSEARIQPLVAVQATVDRPSLRFERTQKGPVTEDAREVGKALDQFADEALRRGETKSALTALRTCIETSDLPACHLTTGRILAAAGSADAKAHFARVIELAPTSPEAKLSAQAIGLVR